MSDYDSKWKKRGQETRKMSLALAIPSMWVGAPIGVGFLFYFLGGLIDQPRTGFVFGFVLGFVIAIRETKRILKQLNE